MKKLFLLATFSFFISDMSFSAPEFVEGSNFYQHEKRGRVRVSCASRDGRRRTRNFHCSKLETFPSAFSEFDTGRRGANKVKITALRDGGKKFVRTRDVDSQTGVSKRFNMNIRTLFQKPLLQMGSNTLEYKTMDGNNVVDQGELTVSLEDRGHISCRSTQWYSDTQSDCENSLSVCNEYFRGNYCPR